MIIKILEYKVLLSEVAHENSSFWEASESYNVVLQLLSYMLVSFLTMSQPYY
jgi:hypothetical protein